MPLLASLAPSVFILQWLKRLNLAILGPPDQKLYKQGEGVSPYSWDTGRQKPVFMMHENNQTRGDETMAELLVVRSKIKDAVGDMNVGGDVAEALSQKVQQLLKEAAQRAKANGRSTVKARDL